MSRPVLSVAFFGADAGSMSPESRYEEILEIAELADGLGLHAVWVPERHFQDFGDIFPNPAVLAAAIASRTRRIGIRAGSVVGLLHNPLRLTEDWSMVQALSSGRAGLSFAAGWNETDFAIDPGAFASRRAINEELAGEMQQRFTRREVKQGLPDGSVATISPRPVPRTPQMPIWLTTSGSPRTWMRAGEIGVRVLASTVGQTAHSLQENIETYRQASQRSGARPWVTLMAHTALGSSRTAIRSEIESSLMAYLRTFLAQTSEPRSEREITMLTRFAFERYWSQLSMLGTVETAAATVTELGALGCNEVACLIDFGPKRESVVHTVRQIEEIQRLLK